MAETVKIDQPIKDYKVKTEEAIQEPVKLEERGYVLPGATFCFKFDHLPDAVYVTLNMLDNQPYELFINSRDSNHLEWSSITTRLISAIFRQGGDTSFVWRELAESFWIDSFYYKGKQYNSLLAVIGETLETYIKRGG